MIQFSGLAVPYEVGARLGEDDYLTVFQPGAFAGSLDPKRVGFWLNHRPASALPDARLGFYESPRGLFVSVSVRDRRWAETLHGLFRAGEVHGFSQHSRIEQPARWRGPGPRIVERAELLEVSLIYGDGRPAFETWARLA